jgi:ubiquinone/menaquinone biosynthesis C-methylase UbiE
MKKQSLNHPRVFDDEKWALSYAKRHAKMGRNIGKKYAKLLTSRGFKGGKILDSGCGSGAMLLELVAAFEQAEGQGVDLSKYLIAYATNSAEKRGLSSRVSFQEADVESLPFEDDFFDVVINTNMLHIVRNPLKMLNEIERVLSPKGELILGDIRRSWIGYFMPIFKTAFTHKEGEEVLRQSNLRPWTIDKGFFWWGVLASESFRNE